MMHFACGHIIVLEMTLMSKTGKSKLISRNEGFNNSGSRQKQDVKTLSLHGRIFLKECYCWLCHMFCLNDLEKYKGFVSQICESMYPLYLTYLLPHAGHPAELSHSWTNQSATYLFIIHLFSRTEQNNLRKPMYQAYRTWPTCCLTPRDQTFPILEPIRFLPYASPDI